LPTAKIEYANDMMLCSEVVLPQGKKNMVKISSERTVGQPAKAFGLDRPHRVATDNSSSFAAITADPMAPAV